MTKTKIYAVANQKGGVGKTTSVINIASVLGSHGKRTLIVDLDPQANATSALGYKKYEVEVSTYDLLLQEVNIVDVLISHADYPLTLHTFKGIAANRANIRQPVFDGKNNIIMLLSLQKSGGVFLRINPVIE